MFSQIDLLLSDVVGNITIAFLPDFASESISNEKRPKLAANKFNVLMVLIDILDEL